jgi:hypothetical protein
MLRSRVFREHAAHCFRVAQSLPEDERPLMLQMAQSWLNLARLAEKHEADNELSPPMFLQNQTGESGPVDPIE